LAVIIHGNLSARRKSHSGAGLPEVTWLLLRKQLHQLRLAERRQWTHAQDIDVDEGTTVGELFAQRMRQLEGRAFDLRRRDADAVSLLQHEISTSSISRRCQSTRPQREC
jgi:hypothetical protein